MNLLQLQNINLKIENNTILDNISLTLNKGEIATLIGINGGGKTSLARIIIGALKPNSGKIIYSPKIKIGYLPQKVSIDKTIPFDCLNFIKFFNPKIKIDNIFKTWCERLKVNDILNKSIHEISGGQLQKIILLQMLLEKNDLLILDEPTQFMDIAAVNEFYIILKEAITANNCGILLISHDLHLVMQKSQMVYCLNRHICCFGKPQDISNHPEYLSFINNNANANLEIGFYEHFHDHRHLIN